LQELSQGVFQARPVYLLLSDEGPDHAKEFVVEVHIGERAMGVGRGNTKQRAEQEAARRALESLAASDGGEPSRVAQ
jgi:ribonuclease-3